MSTTTIWKAHCERAQNLARGGDIDGAVVAFMSAWECGPSAGAKELALVNARLLCEKRYGELFDSTAVRCSRLSTEPLSSPGLDASYIASFLSDSPRQQALLSCLQEQRVDEVGALTCSRC